MGAAAVDWNLCRFSYGEERRVLPHLRSDSAVAAAAAGGGGGGGRIQNVTMLQLLIESVCD